MKSNKISFKEQTRNLKENEEVEKVRCPYGHEFGKDLDKYEDCIDCDEWTLCYFKLCYFKLMNL